MLHQVLFQINAVADQTIWGRIADQALSIVLLAGVSWALWNQYRKLEARFTKYMEEDRKQMTDIIQNNTRVMEQNTNVVEQIKKYLDKL